MKIVAKSSKLKLDIVGFLVIKPCSHLKITMAWFGLDCWPKDGYFVNPYHEMSEVAICLCLSMQVMQNIAGRQ